MTRTQRIEVERAKLRADAYSLPTHNARVMARLTHESVSGPHGYHDCPQISACFSHAS